MAWKYFFATYVFVVVCGAFAGVGGGLMVYTLLNLSGRTLFECVQNGIIFMTGFAMIAGFPIALIVVSSVDE